MKDLAQELLDLQALHNDGRGINSARDIAMYLEREDLDSAKALCFSESDKLSDSDIKAFIIEKIFSQGESHPWALFG